LESYAGLLSKDDAKAAFFDCLRLARTRPG
jgi:hypothetical protein